MGPPALPLLVLMLPLLAATSPATPGAAAHTRRGGRGTGQARAVVATPLLRTVMLPPLPACAACRTLRHRCAVAAKKAAPRW